jgi:hypothetical protein
MFNDLYFKTKVEESEKLKSLSEDEKNSVRLLLKETFRDLRHACHEVRALYVLNPKVDKEIEAAFKNGFFEGQNAHANACMNLESHYKQNQSEQK